MSLRFTVTFDYLCPFARNVNEHVIDALQDGADWDVAFMPFSLAQGHVAPGDPDVWDLDDPASVSGLLALQVGLVVRDHFPDHFLAVHRELFAARHDHGRDLRDPEVLREAVTTAGLDPDPVFELVDHGAAMPTLRHEHQHNVDAHEVWGVPTLIAGDRAVFVRLLERAGEDRANVRRRIERIVELIADFPELHEFKQANLPV